MAVLTVNTISRTGTLEALVAAAAGGDLLPNTGKEWIEVANGGGSSINVTITGYSDGVAVSTQVIAVTNATRKKIGPFPPQPYNNSSNQVAIAYSAVTSVTVGAFGL